MNMGGPPSEPQQLLLVGAGHLCVAFPGDELGERGQVLAEPVRPRAHRPRGGGRLLGGQLGVGLDPERGQQLLLLLGKVGEAGALLADLSAELLALEHRLQWQGGPVDLTIQRQPPPHPCGGVGALPHDGPGGAAPRVDGFEELAPDRVQVAGVSGRHLGGGGSHCRPLGQPGLGAAGCDSPTTARPHHNIEHVQYICQDDGADGSGGGAA
ncbi:hypothetical protein ACFYNO_39715 [Kitasatospora sp. NPDC006697]|uniref:hypothetical protein n=1 Tax=Kitasatospora sp. NPDC006697 TaxID=3364020 RepID=UPI0036C0F6BD